MLKHVIILMSSADIHSWHLLTVLTSLNYTGVLELPPQRKKGYLGKCDNLDFK
jgi:hypothetical protein